MRRVRLGIIGLGRFAERHLLALQSLPEIEVTAVCSRSAERAQEIATRWNIPGRYTDWSTMLAEAPLDAVDVITADHDHTGPVLASLAADKHVLVEKPLATTLADADRMIAMASAQGKILMVGHLLRFDPRYVLVKDRIMAGEVGPIGSIYAWRNQSQALFDSYLYGSPLLGLIIHDIDLLLWYMGRPVLDIQAAGVSTLGHGVADLIWAMLRFEGGALGVIQGSWLNPPGAPSHLDAGLEVRGAKATIQLRDPDRGVAVWAGDKTSHQYSALWGQSYGHLQGPLREQLATFARCVRDNTPPQVAQAHTARQALAVTLRVLAELERHGMPVRERKE